MPIHTPAELMKDRREAKRLAHAKRVDERRQRGLCVRCGKKPPELGRSRCAVCIKRSSARSRKAQRLRNPRQLKIQAVEYKGGKCHDCGLKTEYLMVYDFHHKNPDDRRAWVAKLINRQRTWGVIRKELDKCVMLCANCHRIRHERELRC